MMSRNTTLSLMLAALWLGGCTLAPTYERPAAPVPAAWQVPGEGQQAAAEVEWQAFFSDQRLRDVITQALASNHDLRVSAANIEKARAQYQIQRAALLPAVNASASETASRTPAAMSPSGRDTISHTYSAGVGFAAWELDVFGRVRSLKDQALAQYLALEETQRSVELSLVAEVANVWLTLAADRERLDLAAATLQAQREALALVERRLEVGTASALDLAQARTVVESARYDVARYTTAVAQDENLLTLLVGSQVPAEWLPASLPEQVSTLAELPAGLPADTLLARPDVRAAEQQLIAANANIGAARAAFFPRISLTASTGFASPELSDLFQAGSRTWSFVPQITLPIFNAGANRAALNAAEAGRDAQLAQYEKAIQSAFREVADALVARANLGEQLDAQQALNEAASEALKLSRARYEKGVSAYLAVLDSQRSEYAARQGLVAARQAQHANFITLYKVLGGGTAVRSE